MNPTFFIYGVSVKILSIFIALIFCACSSNWSSEKNQALLQDAKENFEALQTNQINTTKYQSRIDLGKKLYFEKKLSANGTLSCNSCHNLENYGVDNEKTSPGFDGTRGGRNSPTVYNSAIHLAQFWDGRAKDVEEQALGPLLNPIEHGLKSQKQTMKILKDAGYLPLFKKAFKGYKFPFTFKNIGRAIGAYEKTLMTPSRFDDFLNGDITALSSSEKRGLSKFIEVGCVNCHNGMGIGGETYQKLGLEVPYPTNDKGRYEITKDKDDMFVFKVPSLRNVAKTYPYFHDGHINNLNSAITIMGKHQLNVKLSNREVNDIKTFLGSLTAKELKF